MDLRRPNDDLVLIQIVPEPELAHFIASPFSIRTGGCPCTFTARDLIRDTERSRCIGIPTSS